MNGAGQQQHETSAVPAVGAAAAQRFPRTAKLLKHAAFEKVYKDGRRIFSGNLTVFYRERRESPGGPRVGFTVSRALGGAVQRNRMKRRLREAVRMQLAGLTASVDVVINPKRTLLTAEFAQIAADIERAFAQIERRRGSQ